VVDNVTVNRTSEGFVTVDVSATRFPNMT
jgi:hypothetical protein